MLPLIKLAMVAAPVLGAGYFLWWKPKHAKDAVPVLPSYTPPPSSPAQPRGPSAPAAPAGTPLSQVDPLAPPGGYTPGGYNPWINNEPTYQPPGEYPQAPIDYQPADPAAEDPGVVADLSQLGYDINPFSSWGVSGRSSVGASPSLMRSLQRRRALKAAEKRLGFR